MLTRKKVVAVELEATEGTAETLVAADAQFKPFEPNYSYSAELHNRKPARPFRGQELGVAGKVLATLTWQTALKGSGALGTRPAWNDSLIACGFTASAVSAVTIGSLSSGPFEPMETVTGTSFGGTFRVVGELAAAGAMKVVRIGAGTLGDADILTGGVSGATGTVSGTTAVAAQGFEYTPDESSKSATVGLYTDGKLQLMRGARGNLVLEGNAGEPLMLNFTFSGAHVDETDTSLLTPTYQATVEPIFANATLTVDDDATMIVASVSLDLQNTLAQSEDVTKARGILSYKITDWDPQMTVDPEDVLVATYDVQGRLEARSTGRYYAKVGSVAANIITVAAPSMVASESSDGDREGTATRENAYDLLLTSGDDELQIAML